MSDAAVLCPDCELPAAVRNLLLCPVCGGLTCSNCVGTRDHDHLAQKKDSVTDG